MRLLCVGGVIVIKAQMLEEVWTLKKRKCQSEGSEVFPASEIGRISKVAMKIECFCIVERVVEEIHRHHEQVHYPQDGFPAD